MRGIVSVHRWTLIELWAEQPYDEKVYKEHMVHAQWHHDFLFNKVRSQMEDGKRYVHSPWGADWYIHAKDVDEMQRKMAAQCKALCDSGLVDDLAVAIKGYRESGNPPWCHSFIVRAIELPEGFAEEEPGRHWRPYGAKEGLLLELDRWGESNKPGWFA